MTHKKRFEEDSACVEMAKIHHFEQTIPHSCKAAPEILARMNNQACANDGGNSLPEGRLAALERRVLQLEQKCAELDVCSLPGNYSEFIVPGFLNKLVLVHTYGKVGTASLIRFLEDKNIEHTIVHHLNKVHMVDSFYSGWIGDRRRYKLFWIKYYLDLYGAEFSKELHIITAFREPIAYFLSSIFYLNDFSFGKVQKDLFPDQVLSPELITEKMQEIICLSPMVNHRSISKENLPPEHCYARDVLTPIEWLRENMMSGGSLAHLSLNANDSPLHGQPYVIIDRTLLLKYEYIEQYAEGVSSFLNIENSVFPKENTADCQNESLSSFYKEVISRIVIPKNILDFIYDNPTIRMIYSNNEIQQFYRRWGQGKGASS